MKILTWETANFGDRLNELVWPHYIPDKLDDDASELLVGIGSLLNHRLPAAPRKTILGAGVGHGEPPRLDASWHVVWLRGPLSAQALGLPAKCAISDGALLLADIVVAPRGKEYPVAFIPHCSAVEAGAMDALAAACAAAGIELIDPTLPAAEVLRRISLSERVIAEALHGAIVADALRVPWLPVCRRGILAFKWRDWTASMELPYRPRLLAYRPQWFAAAPHPRLSRRLAFPLLRPLSRQLLPRQLRQLARSGEWYLSERRILDHRLARMRAALAGL